MRASFHLWDQFGSNWVNQRKPVCTQENHTLSKFVWYHWYPDITILPVPTTLVPKASQFLSLYLDCSKISQYYCLVSIHWKAKGSGIALGVLLWWVQTSWRQCTYRPVLPIFALLIHLCRLLMYLERDTKKHHQTEKPEQHKQVQYLMICLNTLLTEVTRRIPLVIGVYMSLSVSLTSFSALFMPLSSGYILLFMAGSHPPGCISEVLSDGPINLLNWMLSVEFSCTVTLFSRWSATTTELHIWT